MSVESIRVETQDNGLRAAYIRMPHFRTHSARLTIGAGSTHETPDAYGSAHFLEHVTFQGTEKLPSEADIHRFTEENGIDRNAFTSKMSTSYVANGYDLESVGFLVNQLAFNPILSTESLESERKPIIDELRGYASSPTFYANIAHQRAIRGELLARPIGGSIDDVKHMTPEALRSFYERNYRLGNALLVFCSPEPVEKQREIAEELFMGHEDEGVDQPTFVELGDFNPDGLDFSLQQVDLPLSAQTSVGICLDIPETSSPSEQLSNNLVAIILSKVAHNRMRRELALCYGASVGVTRLSDLNFGRGKSWSHLTANASLNGEDAITGLETLLDDVLRNPLPENEFNSAVLSLQRNVDHLLQSTPAQIADWAKDILSFSVRDEIALTEVQDFAKGVSLNSLRKLHKQLVDTKPLIVATSPDPTVLDSIGTWVSKVY